MNVFLPRPDNIWEAGAYLFIFSFFGGGITILFMIDNYKTKRNYPFNLSWWRSIDPLGTIVLLTMLFAWYLFFITIRRGS
jgi:tellurite resistance protein TehA-like permease